PHPPCSTLFPYTTLFRSSYCVREIPRLLHVLLDQVRHQLGVGLRKQHMSFLFDLIAQLLVILNDPVMNDRDGMVFIHMWVCIELDRKSTRLNSSHVAISY